MHLIKSHRPIYVQVPQVVTNLVFSYSSKGFSPLVPILQSVSWEVVRREATSEDRVKNVVEYLSFLLVC